jgi:hypothetical protein
MFCSWYDQDMLELGEKDREQSEDDFARPKEGRLLREGDLRTQGPRTSGAPVRELRYLIYAKLGYSKSQGSVSSGTCTPNLWYAARGRHSPPVAG